MLAGGACEKSLSSVVSHKQLELFLQEETEETETKPLFSVFAPVEHSTGHLRDTTLVGRSHLHSGGNRG
jgi:hypothetical protein